jgi:hypothetical protein
MLNQSMVEEVASPPESASQVEKFRERLRLIEARVQKQSQEEKLNQVRALLREEATQILLPALQDAMAQMTLQVLPDPKLAERVERTQVDVGRLIEGVGALSEAQRRADLSAREATAKMASTMEAMFAATTEEVNQQQLRTTEELLREQRVLSRRQRVWTLVSSGVIVLIGTGVIMGAVTWWRWDQRLRLGEQLAQLKDQAVDAQASLKKLTEDQSVVLAERVRIAEEVEGLRAEEAAVRLQIRESAETMATINQSRAKAQEDIRRLQTIQEQNRFKLIPGNKGAVFVEIEAEAQPFQYQGRNYVRVSELPSP